jgi:hypothetical protein
MNTGHSELLTVKIAARNIAKHARRATPTQWAKGKNWYHEAHTFCVTLAKYERLPLHSVVGCLAALSPQCSWSDNLRNTLAMVKTRRLPATTAKLPVNESKAFSIVHEGEHPADVLGGLKVRAFYNNIILPTRSKAVTIDTHAARAAFGKTNLTSKELGYVFRPKGNAVIQHAYRIVAKRYKILPHKLQATVWLRVKKDLEKLPDSSQQSLYIK